MNQPTKTLGDILAECMKAPITGKYRKMYQTIWYYGDASTPDMVLVRTEEPCTYPIEFNYDTLKSMPMYLPPNASILGAFALTYRDFEDD